MKYLLPVLLLLATSFAKAQNLCPNGDFEDTVSCPVTEGQVVVCTGWKSYNLEFPDYYNSCHSNPTVSTPINTWGNQSPASGKAYMGLINTLMIPNGTKQYLARSVSPTTIGKLYEVSMSLSLAEGCAVGNDGMGVFFFDNGPTYPVNTWAGLTYQTQIDYAGFGPIMDKSNWVRVADTFLADSAYDNMIIGCFRPPGTLSWDTTSSGVAGMPYYYIDSVVIRKIPAVAILINDSVFCAGDTIQVPYWVKSPYFATGNTLTVQMSGPTGSFATPANIGNVSSTTSGTVQVVIPLGALGSNYKIRIVASNPGDTSFVTRNLLIKPKPTLAVTNNVSLCEGTILNLSATATPGSTYLWQGPSSFTSSSQNPSIANTTVTQSGNYVVTANLNGCIVKDTVSVLVKPTPDTPTIVTNSPLCSGNDITLLAASTTPGVSYLWSGPLSYSSTNPNSLITNTTPAHSGTYSVTAGLNGCTSVAATAAVIVNLTPVTPTAGSNTPVCAGGILNLSANTTTPGVNYNWTGPNGFTSNTQNPSISPVPLTAGGTYNVTADLNGCLSAVASTSVVVNNVSSLGMYPSPNDTLCANNANASFVAVPFNAGTAPQYQWYKNNNLINGATSISYPATGIADGDSFYCRMTVTGVCADPLVLYSNKVGMTVLPLTPGPSVSITADPGLLLSPWQLVKFTAVATNAGAMPKYQWKRNGQDVIGANSDNWSANNLSNGDTISCVVTSDIWCATPASAVSNRMVVNIKLGVEDVDGGKTIRLYPNPNNGSFAIDIPPAFILRSQRASLAPFQGGDLRVDVVDVLGKNVYQLANLPITNRQLQIELPSTVANGVYMLKLGVDGVVYHARFTVSR